MEINFDIAIIGGGIVGLATAYRLSQQFPKYKYVLLEKENRVAAHQTGHNSGVIHSGLYYKPGSAKASHAVNGAESLKQFCAENNIPFRLCGKVVVATEENEFTALEELYRRGLANGVRGLKMIDRDQLKEIEPHASGIKALHIPYAGIVDYSRVTEKLAEQIQHSGAQLLLNHKVTGISVTKGKRIIQTNQGDYSASCIITCAGLHADRVVRMSGLNPKIKIVPFRGEYYKIRPEKNYLVNGLIYPVPDARFPFLGVHFTNLIHGGVEAGPNAVLAFKREGYKKSDFSLLDSVDTMTYPGFLRLARKYWKTGLDEIKRSYSKRLFTKALQKLVPEIQEEDLITGGSGVRAQALPKDGNLVDDFLIIENENTLHVCNAPSPAATASLSIAETIVKKAQDRFGLS
jgi:L-2-hydroxyglutarate oxidase